MSERPAFTEVVARARAAWPGVDLDEAAFLDAINKEEDLHTDDLYLATACLHRLPGAIAAFEAYCFDLVGVALRRIGDATIDADDVRQAIRLQLFAGSPPMIGSYRGRGPLRAWFRVVATRLVLNRATRGPKEKATGDLELLEGIQEDGPELAHLESLYEGGLRGVFPEAFAALTVHERLLLRQHYLDGVTLDQLSAIHDVHRATIKRHLASARDTLASKVRTLLGDRLGLSPSEIDSALRFMQSRFHITVQRMLATDRASTPQRR